MAPTMPITDVQTGLSSEEILEAVFATITYRLEPDGRGTRFPVTCTSAACLPAAPMKRYAS